SAGGQGASPARILLAEDLPMNQEIAATLLRNAGHSVDIVNDGGEAVEAARQGGYDLILMDIQMPGMDGLTATRQIRALTGSAAEVPIVAMTANVLPGQVAAFKQAGMSDHIGKPFNKDQLNQVVARWTRAAAGSTVAAPSPEAFDPAAFDALRSMFAPEKLV